MRRFQGLFQGFSVLQVLAVADDDLLAGNADLADLFHQEAHHALAAAGLAADDDLTLFIAHTDAPEAQVAGDETDQAAHPAALDQVMVGNQREAGVDPVRGLIQILLDLLKGFSRKDQVTGTPDQHGHFGAGGLGVNDGDLLVRFVFQDHVPADQGAVIAAAQGSGNGEGDDRTGGGELFPPGFRGRTGGLRHFGVGFICFQHFTHVHVLIIHIFFAADPDGKGDRRKIHFAFCALQLIEVTA